MESPKVEPTFSALDMQVDGDHYINSIQPVEYIMANEMSFIAGNIVKYASRAPFKGSFHSDIAKIKHYCDLWLELDGDKH